MKQHRVKHIAAIIAVNLLIFFGLGEILARLVPLDFQLLRPLLYYQSADVEAHAQSDDPQQLFHLKPGAVLDTKRRSGDPRRVTINSFGFRDPERQARKAPDVFRIVILGSSNTYGADVDNDQTYPAQLERLLNELGGPKHIEVWNAGISAYVPSQIARHARHILSAFDPDLLILQIYLPGRRAFLQIGRTVRPWDGIALDDFRSWFDRNPELYWENLTVVPLVQFAPARWLFLHSTFYRTLVVATNRVTSIRTNPYFGAEASNDRDMGLLAEYVAGLDKKVKVFRMGMNPAQNEGPCPGHFPDLFPNERKPPSDAPEYMMVHPPAHVYEWVAEAIRDELVAQQLIPEALPPDGTSM